MKERPGCLPLVGYIISRLGFSVHGEGESGEIQHQYQSQVPDLGVPVTEAEVQEKNRRQEEVWSKAGQEVADYERDHPPA